MAENTNNRGFVAQVDAPGTDVHLWYIEFVEGGFDYVQSKRHATAFGTEEQVLKHCKGEPIRGVVRVVRA